MPPTVLQILPSLVTGGVERGTVDVAAALVASGFKSVVASSGGPKIRELERTGAIHVTLPLATKNPLAIRANIKRVADVIAEHGVNIVHARSRAPAWSAKAAAKQRGVPFMTTFHGVYGDGLFGLKRPYNRVMASGERVIAISQFIADLLVRDYRISPERIRLIHRGVDLAVFDSAKVGPQRIVQMSQKLGLTEAVPTIMLPGRLTAWKGHHLLIDALAIMRGRGAVSDLRCLMVGSDQGRIGYREAVVEHAATRGVRDWVHIVDDCADLPAAYRVSDVVVSASTRPEAFGRVVAEAQAMGRPVVAPAHGAAGEIVLAGVTGWLFTPNDPLSLAGAITRALALTAEQRLSIARDAVAHVREYFDKVEMCAKTIAVYRELLGSSPS
ncbi:MAG: glycosyltransferase family 4 protein [Alphaproteobacteria bacterium]|nr:glycosyltransferase family 4 protein [Alphaproteobacteria bacterium]